MIWDTFMFFNELDILECRLTELQDDVDKFVIVESPVTFQGRPKPLYYLENKERFSPWADKIVHVLADEIPEGPIGERSHAWKREGAQREHVLKGLRDADPSDIILIGDVDEIPRQGVITPMVWTGVTLEMSFHMFAVDWRHPEVWAGTMIQKFAGIKNICAIRDSRRNWPRIPNAGWHYTYVGGPEMIRVKVDATDHVEHKELILAWLDSKTAYWGDIALDADTLSYAVHQVSSKIDDSFPVWVQQGKCPRNWFHPIGVE